MRLYLDIFLPIFFKLPTRVDTGEEWYGGECKRGIRLIYKHYKRDFLQNNGIDTKK